MTRLIRLLSLPIALPVLAILAGCAAPPAAPTSVTAEPESVTDALMPVKPPVHVAPKPAPAESALWVDLFDGKTLDGWKVSDFSGNPDEAHVEDGRIILEYGAADLSGVTYVKDLPTMNYEVLVEAMRVDGSDFFCGLTVPVRDTSCSLICGGWGGTLVGISSLDSLDASENETTMTMNFENGRWYAIRVRVTEEWLEAWIDDRKVVDVNTKGRRISVRAEVEASRPFGIAAWNTKGAIRTVRVRSLTPAEIDHQFK